MSFSHGQLHKCRTLLLLLTQHEQIYCFISRILTEYLIVKHRLLWHDRGSHLHIYHQVSSTSSLDLLWQKQQILKWSQVTTWICFNRSYTQIVKQLSGIWHKASDYIYNLPSTRWNCGVCICNLVGIDGRQHFSFQIPNQYTGVIWCSHDELSCKKQQQRNMYFTNSAFRNDAPLLESKLI